MLFYLVFNGVYYQAAVVFPINLHILKIAPIPKVHSLWFLFDFEKNEVDSAFLIYINKGISAKCALITVNDLRIIFSVWRFNCLYNSILTDIAKDPCNKTEEANRQYH